MLNDCVGERLTLEVFLRYVFCKLVVVFSFAAEYSYNVFLRKNFSLGEFYSLLVVDWFVTGL